MSNPYERTAVSGICLAMIGLVMVLRGLSNQDGARALSLRLLIGGLFFAALNAGVFLVPIRVVSFLILPVPYLIAIGLVAFVIMLVLLLLVEAEHRGSAKLTIPGYGV